MHSLSYFGDADKIEQINMNESIQIINVQKKLRGNKKNKHTKI